MARSRRSCSSARRRRRCTSRTSRASSARRRASRSRCSPRSSTSCPTASTPADRATSDGAGPGWHGRHVPVQGPRQLRRRRRRLLLRARARRRGARRAAGRDDVPGGRRTVGQRQVIRRPGRARPGARGGRPARQRRVAARRPPAGRPSARCPRPGAARRDAGRRPGRRRAPGRGVAGPAPDGRPPRRDRRPVRGGLHRLPGPSRSGRSSSIGSPPSRATRADGRWSSSPCAASSTADAPSTARSPTSRARAPCSSGRWRADELTRAIELPARAAGLRMDTTLVPALVTDVLQQPGGLPMLSSTLLELWQRRDGRSLRMETYRALGGISGAVGRVAETVFGRLSPDDQAIARSIFLRLATVGDNGIASRRRVPIGEIDGGREPRRRTRHGGARRRPAADRRRRIRRAGPRSPPPRVAADAPVARRRRPGAADPRAPRRERPGVGRHRVGSRASCTAVSG